MTVSLKGKNAIVTGAAAGIGTVYAQALAAEGVNVAVCDVKPEIMCVAQELRDMGVEAKGFVANTSIPEDVRAVVDGTVEAFGGVDILISNAGTLEYCQADDPLDKTLVDYDSMVGTNLKGLFLFGRAVIPIMIAQGGGEIVNVATDHMVTCGSPNDICPKLPTCPWADEPRVMGADYADLYESSKWGVNGLTFGWAKALRPHNIRVNTMCMGATDSFMLRSHLDFPMDDAQLTDEAKAVISEWMRKEDVARVVMDLIKEGPNGRTGENLNLCVGRPTVLEAPLKPIYILEEDVRP